MVLATAALPAGASAATDPTPTAGLAIDHETFARKSPYSSAKAVTAVYLETPLTGQQTVLPILGRRDTPTGGWLKVRLAIRPNGTSGWIPRSAGHVVHLAWSIRVDLTNRRLAVRHNRSIVRRMGVVIGAKATTTPSGHFFVVEHVRLRTSWSPTGWAMALSAFSNILRHYDGGEGQVAIHARGVLAGDIGSASSHGCVRVNDSDAAWLAHHVPNGTPVRIFW